MNCPAPDANSTSHALYGWMRRLGSRELRCILIFWSSCSLEVILRSVSMCEVTVVDNVGYRIQPPFPSHLHWFWPVGCKQKSWSETPGKTFSKGQVCSQMSSLLCSLPSAWNLVQQPPCAHDYKSHTLETVEHRETPGVLGWLPNKYLNFGLPTSGLT